MPTRREHLKSLAAVAAVAAISPTMLLSEQAAAAAATSKFVPLTPTRFADTRKGFGMSRIGAGRSATLKIVGRREATIPASATAVVVNAVAVAPDGPGHLTVWPNGRSQPTASVLNYSAGEVRANMVTCKIGTSGSIKVASHAGTHVVVDVLGYYESASEATGGRIIPTGPDRAYDSRRRGGRWRAREFRRISLAGLVPDGASAAILNVTGVLASSGTHISVLPANKTSGEVATSTLNMAAGGVVANQAIAPLVNGKPEIVVYCHQSAHVVIDVFGHITGEGAARSTSGLFVPLASPTRFVDTRGNLNPLGPTLRMWPGWTMEVPVLSRSGIPSSGVAGVVGNLTIVNAHDAGFLTAFPAGTGRPDSSSVNATHAGAVAANHQMVPVTSRGMAVYNLNGSHVVFDAAGYITGNTRNYGSTPRLTQIAPQPAWSLTLSVPSIGVNSQVYGSTGSAVIDSGHVGWLANTSYPGRPGGSYLFAHRTDAGGPFRHLNRLTRGQRVYLEGDRRRAVYEVVGWSVMTEAALEAKSNRSNLEPDQLVLVACSRPDGTPTSLAYRIAVTCKLVSYTNY